MIFVKRYAETDVNIYTQPYILFFKMCVYICVCVYLCLHTHTYAHINSQIQEKVWKDPHQRIHSDNIPGSGILSNYCLSVCISLIFQ